MTVMTPCPHTCCLSDMEKVPNTQLSGPDPRRQENLENPKSVNTLLTPPPPPKKDNHLPALGLDDFTGGFNPHMYVYTHICDSVCTNICFIYSHYIHSTAGVLSFMRKFIGTAELGRGLTTEAELERTWLPSQWGDVDGREETGQYGAARFGGRSVSEVPQVVRLPLPELGVLSAFPPPSLPVLPVTL